MDTLTVEEINKAINNATLVCQSAHSRMTTGDVWRGASPLNSASSLLLVQLSLVALSSLFINLLLRHFGQSTVVAQIFSGIAFGPSLLGTQKRISDILFPIKGALVLETFATFGLMFFLFSIGVKVDAGGLLRPGRRILAIGLSLFLFTLILTGGLSVLLIRYIPKLDSSLKNSLPFLSASQTMSSSAVVASLLTELKILNTDIGRIALSSAIFSDLMGITMSSISLALSDERSRLTIIPILSIISALALVLGIVYLARPYVMWIQDRTEEEKVVHETHVILIFSLVLVCGFLSEVSSQHFILGPLIMGFVVPSGPPLGSALVTRVDTLATGIFYPSYLAITGLKTNIFKIDPWSSWVLGLVFLFASIVKVGAVMLPACFYQLPMREAFVLGLILNAKGITELVTFNIWKESKLLTDQEYTLAVIYVLVITAIVTPLIRYLYHPSKKFAANRKSTIQHLKKETELRILACVHTHENIPTMVNLLEVTHATEENRVAVIALILVELVGRTTPLLVEHHAEDSQRSNASRSDGSNSNQIIKALRQYVEHNEGCATLQPFTSVSHYPTMHDDIVRVAFEKKAHIVILPFHKLYAIDGNIGSVSRSHQSLNVNVLDKAPCSVGILIDRGILGGSVSVLIGRYIYHVAVIFIGGVDDAEALAFGSRMATHPNVDITVARFLFFGTADCKERKRDTDLLDEYRRANVGNERFVVVEEVVKDGSKLSSVIKSMVDCFDLMLVGRHHEDSPILSGLSDWSECPELGVVGDMLSSPDFRCALSVLVVQQQRIGGKQIPRTKPIEKEPLIHDTPHDSPARGSWTITVNENDKK